MNKNPLTKNALYFFLFYFASLSLTSLSAQEKPVVTSEVISPLPEKKWYDSINLKGYAQVRYNRLLETNPKLKCEACDRSIGDNGGFFIRRARLTFSGQLNPRMFFYIQTDIAASSSSTNLHFLQVRDAYFDVGIDKNNLLKLRVGQSKVIYGFDNLQSSQNRLAFDRSDALNSGTPNERDLGLTLLYTPENKKKLFAKIAKDGLKGTGDYGIVAVSVYNGQSANKPELNNNKYIAGRFAYPTEISNQIFEGGIHVYTGKWTIASDQLSTNAKIVKDKSYRDQRVSAHMVMYPKPFGIQLEYTVGKGPQFNIVTDSIESKKLKGGYATLSYMTKVSGKTLLPFLRYQFYDGGKKNELDARSFNVKETEIGAEIQFSKYLEFTASYVISNRRNEDFVNQNNLQKGNLLRLQGQLNF